MDYSDRTSSAARNVEESAARAWDETRQKTERMIDTGEECVRENPSSAVLVAFAGGLLLGAAVGWRIAESRHEQRQHSLRGFIRDLQRRMEF